ncbi:MAG: ribonuclease HII [Magnetococcales bacterium]|nr:ribonuclease HII [Magnetococcales bacterium]
MEQGLWDSGLTAVCGVDEAGRGPLAGPVVAGAVILPPGLDLGKYLPGLDDSKRLTPMQRNRLETEIRHVAIAVGVGQAEVAEIDAINIRRASLLAMQRAVAALAVEPSFLLIDGRDQLEVAPCASLAIKGGDGISASIAAASIIAKETRDRIMHSLSRDYPGYGWERNMGYPTQEHRLALNRLGVTPHHRHSFAPVREVVLRLRSAVD